MYDTVRMAAVGAALCVVMHLLSDSCRSSPIAVPCLPPLLPAVAVSRAICVTSVCVRDTGRYEVAYAMWEV